MLPLEKRVNLVSRDLLQFNPPEVFDEMQKLMASNNLPSPQFVDKELNFADKAEAIIRHRTEIQVDDQDEDD